MSDILQQVVIDAASIPNVSWSVCLRDAQGHVLAELDAEVPLPTASVGKLFLMTEVALQYEKGSIARDDLLSRNPSVAVKNSGILQYLTQESLPVEDLVVLVASVSDNYATNILLERIGLPRIHQLAIELGLKSTSLLDRVRNERGDDHPPCLSVGSAEELSGFMDAVRGENLISPEVSATMDRWMGLNADLSMVASALGIDPLAHLDSDRNLVLRNKTGTDSGVRADVGYITAPRSAASYAVIARWNEKYDEGPTRDAVLAAMRAIGNELRNYVTA